MIAALLLLGFSIWAVVYMVWFFTNVHRAQADYEREQQNNWW